MTKTLATIPLNEGVEGPVSQEALTLESDEFPHLVSLLNAGSGDELGREISRLIARFRRSRALRQRTRVFGRLLLPSADEEVQEELVIVEDVSRTGVRVAIPRAVSLDLRELSTAHLALQLGQPGDERPVELPVTFVREHSADDRYSYVAFRFEDLEGEHAALLDHVTNLFFS